MTETEEAFVTKAAHQVERLQVTCKRLEQERDTAKEYARGLEERVRYLERTLASVRPDWERETCTGVLDSGLTTRGASHEFDRG